MHYFITVELPKYLRRIFWKTFFFLLFIYFTCGSTTLCKFVNLCESAIVKSYITSATAETYFLFPTLWIHHITNLRLFSPHVLLPLHCAIMCCMWVHDIANLCSFLRFCVCHILNKCSLTKRVGLLLCDLYSFSTFVILPYAPFYTLGSTIFWNYSLLLPVRVCYYKNLFSSSTSVLPLSSENIILFTLVAQHILNLYSFIFLVDPLQSELWLVFSLCVLIHSEIMLPCNNCVSISF